MRPLVLKMSISLDGFVGGPNGEVNRSMHIMAGSGGSQSDYRNQAAMFRSTPIRTLATDSFGELRRTGLLDSYVEDYRAGRGGSDSGEVHDCSDRTVGSLAHDRSPVY